MLFFGVFLRETARPVAKSRTSLAQIQEKLPINTKVGTHVQIHLGMDICQTNWTSRHKGAFQGVIRGNQSNSLGRLSNGWTDWHQIWYTSADSSGNWHRLNTICPSTFGEGGRGHQFKSQGKMWNGWTDWHQIWYTCAYSSGNGYTPNKLPQETQWGFWGF